jgi:large subunit ribosomal protein L17
MRHGKKFNHLGRPASHRKALLANQAKSLILHKRIFTTVAKAKALRKFIEPIITRSKEDSMHARRIVFSHFQDKEPVKILFNEIVHKIGDRPGGYTRIIKMNTRLGDNAEMCMMELVDYNELFQKETKPQKTKTRRGRGKSKSSGESVSAVQAKDVAQEVSTPQSAVPDEKQVDASEEANTVL